MAKKSHSFLDGGFDLPKLEEKVLEFWNREHIFQRSLDKNKPKSKSAKGRKFVFYEGPPYANGKPGVHHVLARVVKDIVLRYKTMRGYFVPRKAGWDTHGLPVEMATEKALGLKTKRDIEKLGIKVFNEKAKEQVWIYKHEWERLTERIGYWLDLKNAYATYTPDYIESVWWSLSEIAKRKLLYEGHRVVPWCTRCGTSLSSHELAQGYQEVVDNSVYVKFKLREGQRFSNFVADRDTYVVSWTTTAWTLPGNVALAIGEDIPYVLVRTGSPEKASYIVAKDLAAAIFKDRDFAVVGEFPGRRLAGLEYEPLFDVRALRTSTSFKIYPADFVTTTDGTGVVHTAVMYGEDDYALGKKVGLPEHHTVDEDGKFTKDVPGFAGEYVKSKETEEKIFKHLERGGNLLRVEAYTHEYPFCWRCGTPVLYYARTSWFIGMSRLRAELLKRNKGIRWMPEHVKEGRFGEWLREAKDWNLSRERYWGAPLPIWKCEACAHTAVAGSLRELSALAGGSKNQYWVLRHGQAESNLFDIIDSGQRKFLHLTPLGRKQVERSAKRLAAQLGKSRTKIDMVITSDLTRTKETAEIVAKALGAPIMIDKGLEEIHLGPTLTGYRDEKYQELYPTYESRFEERPKEGESLRDLRARMWNTLKEIEARYAGKNILLVGHEYPIWMLTQAAEGWSEKRAMIEKEKQGRDFIRFAEVRKLEVLTVPRNDTGEADLHRPFVDAIFLPCAKCGKKMRRIPEVADVWYDSGAMPFAQAHYPFEHKNDLDYPADYIAEAMDQTRGWFYTLLAIATALGKPAPYKNVITFGLINDKFGKKMSKSKGNIVEPFEVINKYGVDALRWYFYSGTPFGEPKNFDENEIAKAFRRMHLIVYNSFVFWKTYGTSGKAPSTPPASRNVLDRWILARFAELVHTVTKQLDAYQIREAALAIEAFVDDLSRWYIRRSRRRLQRPENQKDFRAASATLGYVLAALTKMLAPFTPFFAEGLHAALGGNIDSVHLENWPKLDKKFIDKKLVAGMASARALAALGLAKRAEAGIKVRQPLGAMTIGVRLSPELQKIVADEVNVRRISYVSAPKGLSGTENVLLDTKITPELREEGMLREVARMVQELRQKAGLAPKDKIVIVCELPAEVQRVVLEHEKELCADVGAKAVEYGRSEKFTAEETTKLEEGEVWIGIRKV